MYCDTSSVGVSAVLALKDWSIAFGSKIFNAADKGVILFLKGNVGMLFGLYINSVEFHDNP